jgi:hypothetical protein
MTLFHQFHTEAQRRGYSGLAAREVARLAVVRHQRRRPAAAAPLPARTPVRDSVRSRGQEPTILASLIGPFRRYARERGFRLTDAVLTQALETALRRRELARAERRILPVARYAAPGTVPLKPAHPASANFGIPDNVLDHYDDQFRQKLQPLIAQAPTPEARAHLQAMHDRGGFIHTRESRSFSGHLLSKIAKHGVHYEHDPASVLHDLASNVLSSTNRYGKPQKTPFDIALGSPDPQHLQKMIHTFTNARVGNILRGDIPSLRKDYQPGRTRRPLPIVQGDERGGMPGEHLAAGEAPSLSAGPRGKPSLKALHGQFGRAYPLLPDQADAFADRLEEHGERSGKPLAKVFRSLATGENAGSLERKYGKSRFWRMRAAMDAAYLEHTGMPVAEARKAIRSHIDRQVRPLRKNLSPEQLDQRDREHLTRVLTRMHRGVPVIAAKLRDKLDALGNSPPRDPISPHPDRFYEVLHDLADEGAVELSHGPQGGLRVAPAKQGKAAVKYARNKPKTSRQPDELEDLCRDMAYADYQREHPGEVEAALL